MTENTQAATRPGGLPQINKIGFSDIGQALGQGWHDFMRAPLYGLIFGGFYAVGGLAILAALTVYDMPWMIIPVAIGFPLIGPFVAVGLYEVSRRLQAGEPLNMGEIFAIMFRQKDRQLGWMAFVILFIFWIWVYQVRLLLALFLGFKSFSSIGMFLTVITTTSEGLGFLAVGTLVGAGIAFVLYASTVVAMPLLLERELDFVSAIITSFKAVTMNFVPMLGFAAVIVVFTFVAMVPAFLGLVLALPVLGHATWHLYKKLVV
ncbi:DUF2189 domain-containing protein [Maritalea sp. S77]|jgi:uncharacterized membrane protein|uniref:DUF2189 domain-containing protein n=1 Tax=Maritalea sp. S77 TaxID=3415125 RepID=UPI003C7D07B7